MEDILSFHAAAHASVENIAVESRHQVNDQHLLVSSTGRNASVLERLLSRYLKPTLRIFGKSVSSYNAFGVLGMAVAATIAFSLTYAKGLSLYVTAGLLGLALLVSIANIVLTTLITGRDSLVFLRYFLTIMAAAALLLRFIDQPILPYLENLMLGIGAMQGVGRIGCFRVGCCYGKPAPFGIRYTAVYARAGFPDPLVNVRLFPIQLLESGWIFVSVGLGAALALTSTSAGYGLSSYILLFSCGRFCFELLRGDKARPYVGWLSEAQWISSGMLCSMLILEQMQILPFHLWHLVTGGIMLFVAGCVIYNNLHSRVFQLKTPAHIASISKVLAKLEKGRQQQLAGTHAVHLRQTMSGLQISDGIMEINNQRIHHYTLSFKDSVMASNEAKVLAKIIQSWHPQEEKTKLISYNKNTFHLLRYHTIQS